jgi:hypothetical protein
LTNVFAAKLKAFLFGPEDPVRIAQRTPRSDFRDVADGETVKIAGMVKLATPPLIAPFSGLPCCCYSALRRKMVDDQGDFAQLVTWGEDIQVRDFFLQSGSSKALVKVRERRDEHHLFEAHAPAISRAHRVTLIVAKRETLPRDLDGFVPSEWRLDEGERVAVYGSARWETDPNPADTEAGYRDTPRILVIDADMLLDIDMMGRDRS